MTLEERIRQAIKTGSFLHLSLDLKWDGSAWECGYRNADNTQKNYVEDPDPIVAMEKAISPLRLPKPSTSKAPRKSRQRRSEDLI